MVESRKLTVGCLAGVALRAVGRVRRGDGGHAGAPDEIKGCEATCCNTACEARRTEARLAGSFGKQRPGRCSLGLCRGCCCCCCLWSRRSMIGKHLICLKKIYFLLWVNTIWVCVTNVNELTLVALTYYQNASCFFCSRVTHSSFKLLVHNVLCLTAIQHRKLITMNETTCLQLLWLWLACWTSGLAVYCQQNDENRHNTVFRDNARSDVYNYKPNTRSRRYKDGIKKELKFYTLLAAEIRGRPYFSFPFCHSCVLPWRQSYQRRKTSSGREKQKWKEQLWLPTKHHQPHSSHSLIIYSQYPPRAKWPVY